MVVSVDVTVIFGPSVGQLGLTLNNGGLPKFDFGSS